MKKKSLLFIAISAFLFIAKNDAVYAEGMNVQVHTPEEIKAYYNTLGVKMDGGMTYKGNPSTKKPYVAGELSDETLKDALNTINFMRYIAGIDADVTLNSDYNAAAQAAALVNAVNGEMTHYPSQPVGMDQALYELGYGGAGSSNIASGYSSFYDIIVNGWMSDDCGSNLETVGHRRWILSPKMQQTGFGYVYPQSAMYCFDSARESSYTNIAWPAQNMPVDCFDGKDPWSITTGVSQWEVEDMIQVTLTRKNDGKVWRFTNARADGDFYVNNGGYGQSGCIIFRPKNISYSEGDQFEVVITGTTLGTISYTVNFFSLIPVTEIVFDDTAVLEKGAEGSFWAYNLPLNAAPANITFTTSNKKIVKIVEQESGYVRMKAVKAGTATITARCVSGERTLTKKCKVTVTPNERLWNFVFRSPSLKSVKNSAKKTAKITWKKYTNASGYQIYMSTKKNSGYKKVTTIKKSKTVTYNKKKLKKGRTYYFKVRAYTKYKGITYYSQWSNVKKVKIKK